MATKRIFAQSDLVDRALEDQADKLLVGYDDVYTSRQLERKCRDETKRLFGVCAEDIERFTDIDNVITESIRSDVTHSLSRFADDIEAEMVLMRMSKLSYADIAAIVGIPTRTCYDRVRRLQARMMKQRDWGLWIDLLRMENCLQSNWYAMFRELILWCAAGRPKK